LFKLVIIKYFFYNCSIMKLSVLTWNINFIHDNWLKRLDNINKTLQIEIENSDIIALQEATLPFSNAVTDVYKFLKNTDINYFDNGLLERNYFYKSIINNFPKYKKYITGAFEYLMNKLLWLCSWVFSNYGEYLKSLYFNYPYFFILLVITCPIIFFCVWVFVGMITILNKKIKGVVESKYIGKRNIQYIDFIYNEKPIRFVNVHLPPGDKSADITERYREIEEIVKFCKEKENVILAGDFNDKPSEDFYKYLKNSGYKSSCSEAVGEELNTFPSNNPEKCIDYIWFKGENIKIDSAYTFGSSDATDHKGIKAIFNIT